MSNTSPVKTKSGIGSTAAKVALVGGGVVAVGYIVTKMLEGGISAEQINITSTTIHTPQVHPGGNAILDFTWYCVSAPTVLKLKWGFIPVREQADYKPMFMLGLRKSGTEEWVTGNGQDGEGHITEGETQDVSVATTVPSTWGDATTLDAGIFCSGIDAPLYIITGAFQVIWGAESLVGTLSVVPITVGEVSPGQEVQIEYTFESLSYVQDDYHFRLDTYTGVHTELGTDVPEVVVLPGGQATLTLTGKVSDAAVPGTPVSLSIMCWAGMTGSLWSEEYTQTDVWTVASFDVSATQFWYGPTWTSMTMFSSGATLNILMQPTSFAITFSNTDVVVMYGAAILEFYYNGTLYYACQKDGVTLTPGTPLAVLFPDKFTSHTQGVWEMRYGFFTYGHWAVLGSFNITVA